MRLMAAALLAAARPARLILRPIVPRGARMLAAATDGNLRRVLTHDATHADWSGAVAALGPFARGSRLTRLNEVLSRRRGGLHVVLENVADPYNTAAILRTVEGLGVQHVHIIESIAPSGSQSPGRKPGKRAQRNVAAGAARWLTVHQYRSPVDCCARLKELDLRILASDCPPCELDVAEGFVVESRLEEAGFAAARPIDATMMEPGRGVAIVFGNERRGVTRAFVERADEAFFLPMVGLTQSFNISVAVAMTLYAAIATGHFPEGTLTEEERIELLGRWLLRDVKAARQILRSEAKLEFADF